MITIGWIVFITIILGIMACFLNQSVKKDKEKTGIIYLEYNAKYLGGIPNVDDIKSVDIKLTQHGLELNIIGYKRLFYHYLKIKNAWVYNHNREVEELNIGKIEVFGYFALGMQDKKSIKEKYVFITVEENNKSRDIMIKSKNSNDLVKKVLKIISL